MNKRSEEMQRLITADYETFKRWAMLTSGNRLAPEFKNFEKLVKLNKSMALPRKSEKECTEKTGCEA